MDGGAPTIEIMYRRPPGNVRRHVQELLHDGQGLKITMWRVAPAEAPLVLGSTEGADDPAAAVRAGGALLWFTFPHRPFEVAAVYDPAGRLLGHYTNLILPPRFAGGVWEIVDLFLDVWQDRAGRARLLDEEELDEALGRGWISPEEADLARATAAEILVKAGRGPPASIRRWLPTPLRGWPPAPVRRWTLDLVPSLRFRRDRPGSYVANLISGRIIGFGLYTLGAASLTSIAFAMLTDAFAAGVTAADVLWVRTILAEAVVLLPLSLAGWLPATRVPRPAQALTERALFLGAVGMGTAALIVQERAMWQGALAGIYAALGLFLAIFAASRAAFDRSFPGLALAGIAVCVLALVILL